MVDERNDAEWGQRWREGDRWIVAVVTDVATDLGPETTDPSLLSFVADISASARRRTGRRDRTTGLILHVPRPLPHNPMADPSFTSQPLPHMVLRGKAPPGERTAEGPVRGRVLTGEGGMGRADRLPRERVPLTLPLRGVPLPRRGEGKTSPTMDR